MANLLLTRMFGSSAVINLEHLVAVYRKGGIMTLRFTTGSDIVLMGDIDEQDDIEARLKEVLGPAVL